ncbi:MAG TPA: HU family DNA-binding protein [Longimicrobiales bacterium]|nr:HU family DNA-binding protein [Longimicrobiales bacterium]
MNKSDLVDALASSANMTKADASRAVEALFAPEGGIIADALKGGRRVQITGFGTFEAKQRKARTGRNPRTGQQIQIAATKTPGFRAGKGLKDAIQ